MTHVTQPRYRRRISPVMETESMTEQHHKDECDIHRIMKKYKAIGVVDHLNKYEASYMDLVNAPDFKEAQDMIANMNQMFMTIPSHIRDQFKNDPAIFLDFVQNPENFEEIEALGLTTDHLEKPSPKTPEKTQSGAPDNPQPSESEPPSPDS